MRSQVSCNDFPVLPLQQCFLCTWFESERKNPTRSATSRQQKMVTRKQMWIVDPKKILRLVFFFLFEFVYVEALCAHSQCGRCTTFFVLLDHKFAWNGIQVKFVVEHVKSMWVKCFLNSFACAQIRISPPYLVFFFFYLSPVFPKVRWFGLLRLARHNSFSALILNPFLNRIFTCITHKTENWFNCTLMRIVKAKKKN